jgi:Putative collagen-binding domain of a collagenase
MDWRRLRNAAVTATVVAATLWMSPVTVGGSGAARVAPSTVTAADTSTPAVALASGRRWPSSIAGRKVLDQHGDVYLIRTFSSWAMASHLSNAQITSALKGVAANRFNGVTVWIGGGANYGSDWSPRYRHKATERSFWRGTPWASPLGGAWASLDHLVAEARRLGIFVWMSLNGGFPSSGARADWEAVTNTNMRRAGVAIARRYRSAPNVGWHVMFDDNVSPSSPAGRRIEAFFDGVNDTEGARARPVRWVEVANGSSTKQQGWLRTPKLRATINSWYEYGSNSTEIAEAGYAEVRRVPVGDSEPPYDGSPHYGGNVGQQLRERSYATFLEGGSLINYGHEDWWRFGRTGLYSEGLTWRQVQRHSHTVQQSRAWRLLDRFVARRTWVPDNRSFLTTGTGTGDTKAAAGRSATTAVAYFPSRRSVVVNTTVIAGTKRVRLRWYNPITGRYRVVSTSEAQRTNRAVRYPHRDGTNDWVLVVNLA